MLKLFENVIGHPN